MNRSSKAVIEVYNVKINENSINESCYGLKCATRMVFEVGSLLLNVDILNNLRHRLWYGISL